MSKEKTLDQIRAERDEAERRLVQARHELDRLENRKRDLEQQDRKKRTHRLCNLGGVIESIAPEVSRLTCAEMIELMERIFHLPEVREAIDQVAANAEKGKEDEELKTAA